MAAVLGFEPRQTESESAVLPLHNTALSCSKPEGFEPNNDYYTRKKQDVKTFFKKFFPAKKIAAGIGYYCGNFLILLFPLVAQILF